MPSGGTKNDRFRAIFCRHICHAGVFILAFGLVFLLALALFPVEKELSKVVWSMQRKPRIGVPQKGSFKDFSRKH